MLIQTEFDVTDKLISPSTGELSSITGIIARNNKGHVQVAYQFHDEFVWYPADQIHEVNNGK